MFIFLPTNEKLKDSFLKLNNIVNEVIMLSGRSNLSEYGADFIVDPNSGMWYNDRRDLLRKSFRLTPAPRCARLRA